MNENEISLNKSANVEIDILKFLFSIVVVAHHWMVFGFETGGLAVEFFFIASGFFFTKKVFGNHVYDDGGKYILKSIKGISPFLFAGILVSLVWNFFLNSLTTDRLWVAMKLSFVGEMLHFQMFGLPMYPSTGVAWYLSAMYMGMAFLALLFRKTRESFPTIVLGLTVLFVYGWLNRTRSGLQEPGDWLGNCYVGALRGIAGISLGALCYRFVLFLRNFGFNLKGRIFLSAVEFCFYARSVFYMWRKSPSFWDFYVVLMLFIAVSISLSELSLFSFVNKWKMPFFRRASICILFSHYYAVQYFEKNFPQFTGLTAKLLVVLQVVLLSVLNYVLAGLIRSACSKIVKALRTESARE